MCAMAPRTTLGSGVVGARRVDQLEERLDNVVDEIEDREGQNARRPVRRE